MTADDVRKLRDVTGAGLPDCKRALERSGGDLPLAAGYLRMDGLAVHIRGDRAAWEDAGAQKWAEQYRADGAFEAPAR